MKMIAKRAVAAALAFLLIATMLPTDVVSAAAKKPTLSATTKTVTVGKTTKLTVKNKVDGSTYKWISKNTKIARVSQKGTVRGVKAGKTSIVCKVNTGKKNYRLVCKVTVKNASQTSQTVATQKELNTALKNTKLKKLTIKTTKDIAFEIPEGDYSNVDLVVDAPNADISNSGVFKSIDIKAIKPDTWKEKAKGNQIKITAVDARIVVETGASLAKVSVTMGGGKIKIQSTGSIDSIVIDAPVIVDLAVDGKIGEVAVNAASVVSVEGNTKEAVPIKVSEEAKGSTLASSTPVDVKAATDISLTLSKGAEGSKVEATGNATKVEVKNDTTEAIKVVTPTGTKEVAKDTSSKVDTSTSGSSSTSTSTTNPGYIYTSPDPLKLTSIVVKSPTQIGVYFNQTVPAQVSVQPVIIGTQTGTKAAIAKVERHPQDTQSYLIDFTGALEKDTYQLTMSVSGKNFSGSFKYDAENWTYIDAARAIVLSKMKETYTVSSTAKQSAELCRIAFASELQGAIWSDPIAKDLDDISIQTRPFKYEEDYPDKAKELPENTRMVSIWVGLYEGDAWSVINDYVRFDCTGDAMTIDPPTVKDYNLKSSIVVANVPDYQFACVKSDVTYENIPTDAWKSYNYYVENIEFNGLESGATYMVYKRLASVPEVHVSSGEITLNVNGKEAICVAEVQKGDPLSYYESVVSGATITTPTSIKVPLNVNTECFGILPDNTDTHGSLICTAGGISDYKLINDNSGILQVEINLSESTMEKLVSGENIIKFEYRYCLRDTTTGKDVLTSDPVILTVTVNVTGETSSP